MFFLYKNQFLGDKCNIVGFFAVLFDILPKLNDFVNPNDCIGKITCTSIRLQPVFIKKKLEVNRKQIYLVKKG